MKIFLSSTCYDLVDLRARLDKFLRDIGHEPMLSDRPSFPVEPGKHRHDVCVDQAGRADLLIAVIDYRFGACYYKDNNISITWAEINAAIDNKVDAMVFVRRSIFDERLTWKKNNEKIIPAHCDNVLTFRLLNQIQENPAGIWCQPFDNAENIVEQLKEISTIKTGQLAPAPSMPPELRQTKLIPVDRLSPQTYNFMRTSLHKNEENTIGISEEDVKTCLLMLPEEPKNIGIMLDFEIQSDNPENLFIDYPVRPAEDDGSSWFVLRRLSAKGHAIRKELIEIRAMFR